jgi:hypothetical protein
MKFHLYARVDSDDPRAVEPVLKKAVTRGAVKKEGESFVVSAELEGQSAKDLNRTLLSSLRRAEKRTRLRAEWESEDGTVERYFDYVLKKTTRA